MESTLEVYDKICFESALNKEELTFIGKANIWIEESYDAQSLKLAQYILSETLTHTALGQVEIVGFDSEISGVFSPFSSFSSGEQKLLKMISSEEDLLNYLFYLRDHIHGVQNVIQGRFPSLFEFRESLNQPIESYKLIVLYVDMDILAEKIKILLNTLIKAGPRAGVSFLVISPTTDIRGLQFENYFHIIEMRDNQLVIHQKSFPIPNLPVSEILKRNTFLSRQVDNSLIKPIEFLKIMNETKTLRKDFSIYWSKTSRDGLTFTVGQYGLENVAITLGDEVNQRHNVLITGAVGQGKSNLLSVIIHSLCYSYSPRELNLYMLDFKEGVTLKAFSNIGRKEYLPHAKALGLESDVEFGLSVLEFLYEEYRRRLALFKFHDETNIRAFRTRFPDYELPRIVVVIDEFQLMFGEDAEQGRKIVDMLEKSVRLFRAAGIHFILASQTISGSQALLGKMDSIFSQVPIRIAHKNSFAESQMTLGIGNVAAGYLKPREAIVNLDYGEISQNKKVVIAFADEKVLKPLRDTWWSLAHRMYPAPLIFDPEAKISLVEQESLFTEFSHKFPEARAYLGKEIAVSNKFVTSHFLSESGRNIAIIGANSGNDHTVFGMVESMAISLALGEGSETDEFIFCVNGEQKNKESLSMTCNILEKIGHDVFQIESENLISYLNSILSERKEKTTKVTNKIFVFALGMDSVKLVSEDPFSMSSPLATFLEEASSYGIHFVGWWIKNANFEKQAIGMRNSSELFNTKLFLKVDARTLQSHVGPFINWKTTRNRVLYVDEIESEQPISFIPFSEISYEDYLKIEKEIIRK